jgi:hypothetical protein
VGTTVTYEVEVVDGEAIPVPAVEVAAHYRYTASPRTWSAEVTDGEGIAHFNEVHPEPPVEVCLSIGEVDCGSRTLQDGDLIIVEV